MLSAELQTPRSPKSPGDFAQSDLPELFRSPPATHRPVPFYWWAGGRLDRDRLAWQLDRLKEGGVNQAIVSYPHHPDGTTDAGDPALFSAEWWDLFRWFLSACSARGMKAGFQDYTLLEPVLHAIGTSTAGMEGGRMTSRSAWVREVGEVVLSAGAGDRIIGAWAYPVREGTPAADDAVDLSGFISDGSLRWKSPPGEWFAALVYAETVPFDPMHPEAGPGLIRELYQPFERECGGEFGETLNLFFQDELDFGSRMPFWSGGLMENFQSQHGYDPGPWLAALWQDLGPVSGKFRIDYADTVVGLIESHYFKPIFDWHEERGILFGHDNSGRGGIALGRSFYGDYFRTMRWFSAPGCDDPKIHGPRAFKGLKVNASIARLHERPRVWVEAFHSSGWGTTPAEVVAALNEDFAYGATVVNLHGLYYTTHGGWWEWAPPDFHFRQPYWSHAAKLNDYAARMCWLLSQGAHRCDVALVYPITSLHAQVTDPARDGLVAHVGNDDFRTGEPLHPSPEEAAFGLGKFLFDRACDFDFIDDQSLANARPAGGILHAASGRYRVLIVPAMETVRMSMLEVALEFVNAGGVVIAFGKLPRASDRGGRADPEMQAMVNEIFGTCDESRDLRKYHRDGGVALYVGRGYERVLRLIRENIESDVTSSVPVQVLHRQIGLRNVYYLFNPSPDPVAADMSFRSKGTASWWDAWTGTRREACQGGSWEIDFEGREGRLLVFEETGAGDAPPPSASRGRVRIEPLDGLWDFIVQPTLDNCHGDFELPIRPGLIGPQARRFHYADESEAGLTDWRDCTFSFGTRMESAGPFSPDLNFVVLERIVLNRGCDLEWSPYDFSTRWGIERDPFLTDWLSGPHGLKGRVPDEFLDFHSEIPGSVWYVRAKVLAGQEGEHRFIAGARCAYRIWINGVKVASQDAALPPGIHPPWGIPHYQCEPIRTSVTLRAGENDIVVRLEQAEGQRTRAYFAFDPPDSTPDIPALRWFAGPEVPRPCLPAPDPRLALRFRFPCPPGTNGMEFVSRGPARAWVSGIEREVEVMLVDGHGCHHCHVSIDAPVCLTTDAELRIEAPRESRGGDALVEPVRFSCGHGQVPAGDWREQGMATYSGAATYSRVIEYGQHGQRVTLDLGRVSATAEVRVNGRIAATLVAPPWKCDITSLLQPGANDLSITVANTLANHYSVGFPTPYAFDNQTPSGLFGPVCLIHD